MPIHFVSPGGLDWKVVYNMFTQGVNLLLLVITTFLKYFVFKCLKSLTDLTQRSKYKKMCENSVKLLLK